MENGLTLKFPSMSQAEGKKENLKSENTWSSYKGPGSETYGKFRKQNYILSLHDPR